MKNGCCTKCRAKSKKLKEESREEEDMKQNQKVSDNEKPKIDSDLDDKKEKEKKKIDSDQDDKEKEKKKIVTWQKASKKKEKAQEGNKKNSLNEKNIGYNQPGYSARPMMFRGGGPNTSNGWHVTATPRGGGFYPPFTKPPPMFEGPYGSGVYGYGPGPTHPYQSMTRGAHISPYPPMGGAFPPHPYWQTRPDTNPMTRYTSYRDNYSYCFI